MQTDPIGSNPLIKTKISGSIDPDIFVLHFHSGIVYFLFAFVLIDN